MRIVREVLERHRNDLENGAIVTVTRHLMRIRRPAEIDE